MRESTERVARTEPDSGTVNVHSKAAGTDHRLTVEQQAPQSPSRPGLGEAQTITAKALGPKAKALTAQTESGAYRGPIIGQTDQFVLQRQSSRFSVAHEKALLDSQPAVGETVSINYAGGAGTVREYHERSRTRERER